MPTDTERLDFVEKQAREYEEFMRNIPDVSHVGPFAWADYNSSLIFNVADGEYFHYPTARASIDAAMAREGVLLPPEQPKPAAVPLSDTEPDEPVVQEVCPSGETCFAPECCAHRACMHMDEAAACGAEPMDSDYCEIKEETRG